MTRSHRPCTLPSALAALVALSFLLLHPESAVAQQACVTKDTGQLGLQEAIANAKTCAGTVTDCATPPLPAQPPPGSRALQISKKGHYFDSSTTSTTIPLLGLSYDYICHICQKTNDASLCTLNTFPRVFDELRPQNFDYATPALNNNLSVLRLTTIFNSSPGASACTCVYTDTNTKPPTKYTVRAPAFPNEEVYRVNGRRWHLNRLNRAYLTILDHVVGAANAKGIVVEVTLFDPWDRNFLDSPFNLNNAAPPPAPQLGFQDQGAFVNETNDNSSMPQYVPTRMAQKNGACAIVQQLSKYPNVIFEIANEPDFLQAAISESEVVAWEKDVANYIRNNCNLGGHLIQMNGHHLDSQGGTFAWDNGADLASAHYAFINNVPLAGFKSAYPNSNWTATFYGALDQLKQLQGGNEEAFFKGLQSMPLAFNEGLGLPDVQYPNTDGGLSTHPRTDEDARSEALEFITSGGGLFDGFSDQKGPAVGGALPGGGPSWPTPDYLITELKQVATYLVPGSTGVTWLDGMVPASCCDTNNTVQGMPCPAPSQTGPTGPWCWNMLPYGSSDRGNCQDTLANIYWSTIANTGTYQAQPGAPTVTAADALLYVHHAGPPFFGEKTANRPPDWAGGYQATQCTSGYNRNLNVLAVTAPGQVTGCYSEIWISPKDGTVLNNPPPTVYLKAGDATAKAVQLPPAFPQDILLLLKYLPGKTGPNCAAASMTATFTPTCNNLNCAFNGSGSSGSISSYAWDWGDTTSSTMTTSGAPHIFTAPGHYVVSLTVSDGTGDSAAVGQQLTVTSQPPTPSFTVSCNQMSCTFTSGSAAGEAPITGYLWSFGDANFANGPALTTTTNTYAFGGVYEVSLTLTDNFGVTAATTQTITVIGPPEAVFTVTCGGLTCAFDGSGSAGDSAITSYSWTFGDGPPSGTGTGVSPMYSYKGSGTYSVTLTVTDANGQTGSVTDAIDIYGPPSANFTFSCPSTGLQCTFYSSSVPAAGLQLTTWTWDFGDGTVVTNPSLTQSGQPELAWQPQYTYAAPGLYTVTLTVTDTAGNTASIALAVLVNMPPVANPDSVKTVRDTPVTIDLLANDSDPDGDALTFTNVSLAAYPGAYYTTVQLANGRWGMTLTPPNAFVGTMTFSYQACDKWGACSAPATITVTVTSAIVNALGDQFYCPQNLSIQIPVAVLLANDYQDNGLPLHIVSYDTSFLMGTLVCTSTVCTYTPPTGAAGFTQFHYTIADTNNVQDTAPVRIYVGVTDQAPTANDIFLTTTWNSPVTFTITDIAFKAAVDSDGDTLTIGVQSQKTAYGTLVCSTPMYTCTYTPNTGYAGTDRFLYTASDMINPPVTAAINVLTLPSPTPTFDTRGGVVVTGQNQSAWISSGILANDYLPNGGPETVTSFSTAGLLGSLNCGASGCTYTPYSGFVGTTSFTYTATDSHGATDSAIVKICVGCTNHAPVATPQKLSTSATKVLKFSVFDIMHGNYDPDDDPLFVSVYTVTAKLGTLSCGSPQYWCTYTPNGTTGADVITYVVSDGQVYVTSTLTISVGP